MKIIDTLILQFDEPTFSCRDKNEKTRKVALEVKLTHCLGLVALRMYTQNRLNTLP